MILKLKDNCYILKKKHKKMKKRDFLKSLSGLGLSVPVMGRNFERLLTEHEGVSPEALAKNEEFWGEIRSGYVLKPDYINLENGYYCITPQPTFNAFVENIKKINYHGSYYMRNDRFPENTEVRHALAKAAGCLPEEIVVTRNTTESLDTVISGYDWKPGDEAVMAVQDYGAMLDHFDLQAKRYGMVNKRISVPLNPASDEEIVEVYEKAITPKTRLLMVCHIINITGQILPIKKISDMAHKHGVDVLVDGAHAFAHFDYKISDLGCDYYGTSLHKWLSSPLGVGFLYVRKGKAKSLWPIFGDNGYADDDIRKLNHTGTPAVHTDISILNALDYLQKIGIEKKEARLRYIKEYWVRQVRDYPGILVNTPADPKRSCGIANVGIAKMKPGILGKTLLEKYKIWTVPIDGANVHGCRITPNIYTTTEELDVFVKALKELAI